MDAAPTDNCFRSISASSPKFRPQYLRVVVLWRDQALRALATGVTRSGLDRPRAEGDEISESFSILDPRDADSLKSTMAARVSISHPLSTAPPSPSSPTASPTPAVAPEMLELTFYAQAVYAMACWPVMATQLLAGSFAVGPAPMSICDMSSFAAAYWLRPRIPRPSVALGEAAGLSEADGRRFTPGFSGRMSTGARITRWKSRRMSSPTHLLRSCRS